MVSVEVVPVTLAGLAVTVSPLAAVAVIATGFANPLFRVMVTVALALVPCCTLTGVGETESPMPGALVLNVAATLFELLATGVSVHVSVVPVHAPVQLANTLPAVGAAVSVTDVPTGNCTLHRLPQLMPAGSDVTVPDPEPTLATVIVGAAVTVSAMLTVEESVPSFPRKKRVYGPVPALRATRMEIVLEAELLPSAGELSVAVILSGIPPTDNDTVPFAFPTIDRVAVAV